MSVKRTIGKTMAEIGLGAVAMAAATAGAVFFYGKDGAKHRKKIKGWAMKMRGEVVERLENIKEWNEEMYQKSIDEVASSYRSLKNVDTAEIDNVVKELKSHWRNIKRELTPAKKTSAKKAPAKKKTK